MRSLGFDPRPVYVEFIAVKMVMLQGFIRVLLLSPVTAITSMLHTHLFDCHRRNIIGQQYRPETVHFKKEVVYKPLNSKRISRNL